MVRPVVPRRLVSQTGLPATENSRSHSFGRLFPCGYFRFGFKIRIETALAGDVAPTLNDAAGSAKPRIGKHLMIAVVDVDPTAEFAGVFLPTGFHFFGLQNFIRTLETNSPISRRCSRGPGKRFVRLGVPNLARALAFFCHFGTVA